MATQVKPLADRIVVKPKSKEEVTKGGILLPETTSERPQEGEVIAVGPGKVLDNGKKLAVGVKVGDKIMYAKYAGTEVKLDNEDFLILRESDVLAIVE